MAEYIDKEKMLKYLEENNTDDEWIVGQYNADWIYSFIESQPTADVVEVKHGEWIEDPECKYGGDYICSICGNYANESSGGLNDILTNYSSNCGANMDAERKEGD